MLDIIERSEHQVLGLYRIASFPYYECVVHLWEVIQCVGCR
jgi:hypothetical protein